MKGKAQTSQSGFTLGSPEDVQADSARRHIVLEGVRNFRDFGDYPAQGGRQIKRGHLFRSSSLTYMAESDWQLFDQLEIELLLDLRCQFERDMSHNPAVTQKSFRVEGLPILPGSLDDLLDDGGFSTVSSRALFHYMQDMSRRFALEQGGNMPK